MVPAFLFPEAEIRENVEGPIIDLEQSRGKVILLTLGITRIIEQESLEVSVWGSADGSDWGAKPLVCFPQKFYCGTYQQVLDLSQHPEVRHLRASCKVARWGRSDAKPLFGLYLFVQEAERQVMARSA